MNTVPNFDELNQFKSKVNSVYIREDSYEWLYDDLLELVIDAYVAGDERVRAELGAFENEPNPDAMRESIFKHIDGKTFADRLKTAVEKGSATDVVRIAETEAHRNYETARFDAAVSVGATKKTWVCQMLPTSRDTHIYLNGITVPIDALFYSSSGASAQFPGEFGVADEDVNCLCSVKYSL